MGYKRKISFVAVLVLMSAFLCGGWFKPKEMTMDTDLARVYRNEPVEFFLLRAISNSDAAKKEYKDQYFMMYGKLRSKSSDKKQVTVGMTTATSADVLICKTSDAEVMEEIADLQVSDIVKVYGKMNMDIWGKWTMSIDKIERTYEKSVSRTAYSVISGKTVDKEKLEKRELKDGLVTFYIPSQFKGVEKNIIKEELGTMEGYQYCLNEIDRQSVTPESLFVCYFDSDKLLLRPSDKGQTEQIERAIVENILGKDPGKAVKKTTTSYGAEYHYYHEAYSSDFGQTFHAEFILQPVETKGFVTYLYVYRDKAHLDDVMLLLRTVMAQTK